ncbi:hypothetical protein [Comamonas sp. MYb396]|uniref:hypothetical protein n=1 Tax=Comamonas sp. MYb396 TaxID=2745302 RepID=UPI00309DB4CD
MSEANVDPRDALRQELEQVELDKGMMRALSEIAYTAEEGGIIGIRWSDDSEGHTLAKLVVLAMKYKDKLPTHLRM